MAKRNRRKQSWRDLEAQVLKEKIAQLQNALKEAIDSN